MNETTRPASQSNGHAPPVALLAEPGNPHLASTPVVQPISIHDLLSEDGTRLERDEEHINALVEDFKLRQRENPGEHPVHTPLRVIPRGGKFWILAGNNRYLAALRVPLRDLPCLVLSAELDEAKLLIEQGKDNELHQGYQPLERARNVLRVAELRKCSNAEAGRLLGIKSASDVAKLLGVLKNYPVDLHPLIGEGEFPDGRCKVPITTAYTLSLLHPDEAKIRELTDRAVKGLLTRVQAEEVVASLRGRKAKKAKPIKARDGQTSVQFAGDATWASIKEFAARLTEAAGKGEKLGASVAMLPGLLKSGEQERRGMRGHTSSTAS